MKSSIITLFLFFIFFKLNAQNLEEYFVPKNDYINNTFQFSTEWKNENGKYLQINEVSYNQNNTNKLEKYIEQQTYRYNILEDKLIVNEIYYLSPEEIILIFRKTSVQYTNDYNKNVKILMQPKDIGIDNWDPDITEIYSSKLGSTTTEYGNYKNCIIVSKKYKSKTGAFKNFENREERYYYAKNLGLIKTELYINNKKSNNFPPIFNGGVLIDSFSEYSYEVQRKRVAEEIEQKKLAKEKAIEHKQFLNEIKTKIYNYDEIMGESHSELTYQLEKKLEKICLDNSKKTSIDINLNILFEIDSTGIITYKNNGYIKADNTLNQMIDKIIKEQIIPTGQINDYNVNSKFNFKYNYSYSFVENKYDIKYNSKNITFRDSILKNENEFINNELKNNKLPYGKYTFNIIAKTTNGKTTFESNMDTYKSFCGPIAILPSIFIPGIGNNLVSGGAKSGIGTTLFCYSTIGLGLSFKNLSNSYYKKSLTADNPRDVDNYNQLANDSKDLYYTFIAIGSTYWIYNIYRVYKKGKRNNENQKNISTKYQLNISYNNSNNLLLGLTLKL